MGSCMKYIYGGCGGNSNRFSSSAECEGQCGKNNQGSRRENRCIICGKLNQNVWKHPEWLDHAELDFLGIPGTMEPAGGFIMEDAMEMAITS